MNKPNILHYLMIVHLIRPFFFLSFFLFFLLFFLLFSPFFHLNNKIDVRYDGNSPIVISLFANYVVFAVYPTTSCLPDLPTGSRAAVMYKEGVSVHTKLNLNTLIVKIVNEKLFPGYPTSTMSFLVMEPTLSVMRT